MGSMQTEFCGERSRVDLETWERRVPFEFFSDFTEPYHGVCLRVECTETFRYAKEHGYSVFLSLLHRSLVAANQVENFKTRIVDGEVWLYRQIHGGSAVGRANGTIGFGYYPFRPGLKDFVGEASLEVERVKQRHDLERHDGQDLIRYSVQPWFDFTSVSHARNLGRNDSAPMITFGKITELNGRRTMPVSIHVHHGLADGLHVARFVELFEKYLAAPELM
ncbi:MAG: CatA-like O-acetyltransferase [Acidobacteriaceae bacterium]